MRFGFDIDDTLINLREHAFHIYRMKLKKHVPIEEFHALKRVEIHEPFGLTDEEGSTMWNSSLEDIYYTDCPPYQGAVEVLNKLIESGHEIFYITARPKEHGERTKNWIKQQGFPVIDEHFFYGMQDHEKIHIIKELKLDYYIDDKPAILDTLSKEPIELFLKDQSYNRAATYNRILDWEEFLGKINNHTEVKK
ncbi:HAD hydrolase-like protein [Ornithinibacillus sp. BX22]|uniref:Nucleotidase n=1 Tax=Ornithinibacillus hominis TaxID=2763055 RepID=A0A923L5D0_9BACI|nr:HAD family acid phosphatase [Ornithinibacillus hominis]MBC5636777.1 HAD hydrolase-like protein [Ornithinibacillus hominis]